MVQKKMEMTSGDESGPTVDKQLAGSITNPWSKKLPDTKLKAYNSASRQARLTVRLLERVNREIWDKIDGERLIMLATEGSEDQLKLRKLVEQLQAQDSAVESPSPVAWKSSKPSALSSQDPGQDKDSDDDLTEVNSQAKEVKVKSMREAMTMLEDLTGNLTTENLTETANTCKIQIFSPLWLEKYVVNLYRDWD
ncbi:hypothetical protein ACROYT_G014852 [Oculina patagonica]